MRPKLGEEVYGGERLELRNDQRRGEGSDVPSTKFLEGGSLSVIELKKKRGFVKTTCRDIIIFLDDK